MEQRTIKFKAKCLNSSEWVEGDILHAETLTFITWFDCGFRKITEVDPSTVCQFTGLKDKNGKEIWEHDIIKLTHENGFVQKAAIEYFQNSFIGMDGGIHIQICLYGGCDKNTLKRVENLGSKFDRKEHKV